MRFEQLRRVDLLVAEFCFAKDFRLQHKRNEILDALPLDYRLRPFLVNGDIQFQLPCRVKHVGFLLELVVLFLENHSKTFRLIRGEGCRVGMQSFC